MLTHCEFRKTKPGLSLCYSTLGALGWRLIAAAAFPDTELRGKASPRLLLSSECALRSGRGSIRIWPSHRKGLIIVTGQTWSDGLIGADLFLILSLIAKILKRERVINFLKNLTWYL